KIIVWPIVSILCRISLGYLSLFAISANTRKIFQTNSAIVGFGELDNLLANDVVDMLNDSPFFALQSLQDSSLSCFLQLAPQSGKLKAHLSNSSRTEETGSAFRRTGNSYFLLPSINTNPSIALSCIGNFHRATDERIPNTF